MRPYTLSKKTFVELAFLFTGSRIRVAILFNFQLPLVKDQVSVALAGRTVEYCIKSGGGAQGGILDFFSPGGGRVRIKRLACPRCALGR